MTRLTGHPHTPTARRAAATALALLLTGCASGSGAGGAPSAPASSAAASPSPAEPTPSTGSSPASPVPQPSTPTPSASTPSAPTAADATVDIRLSGGKADKVQTVRAKAGQLVVIRGTSDTAESLHLHGYDKSLELQPGKPAELSFTADVKGVFEIETHESEQLVAKLAVS